MDEIVKRGPGRPKGSKDRRWASMEYWHSMIERNMQSLTAKEKVRLGQWGCEIILGKMREITSPDVSKSNVEETMQMLKAMEDKAVKVAQ